MEPRKRQHPTHQDIISTLLDLGYPANKEGTCYGVAVMGMQATLASDLHTFDKQLSLFQESLDKFGGPDKLAENIRSIEKIRIEAIKKYRDDLLTQLAQRQGMSDQDRIGYLNMSDSHFYTLLEQMSNDPLVVDYKNKRHDVDKNELDPVQQWFAPHLMSVRSFLDGAALHQSPASYSDIFEKGNLSQNAELTLPLILPDNLLADGKPLVEKIHSSVGIYNLNELTAYFAELTPPPNHLVPPPVFLLSCHNHTLSVTYDSGNESDNKKGWRIIDANYLEYVPRKATANRAANVVLKSFSDNNVDPNARNTPIGPDNFTTFKTELFCHSSNAKEVKEWLSGVTNKPEWQSLHNVDGKQSRVDSNGVSLLHTAISAGDAATVGALLKCEDPKVNVNQAYDNHRTPLFQAVFNGNTNIIEGLLQAGANANQVTDTGVTPFLQAVHKGDASIVKVFLEHDPTLVYQTLPNGSTAFDIALEQGDKNIINQLKETQNKLDKIEEAITSLSSHQQDKKNQMIQQMLDDKKFAEDVKNELLLRVESNPGDQKLKKDADWVVGTLNRVEEREKEHLEATKRVYIEKERENEHKEATRRLRTDECETMEKYLQKIDNPKNKNEVGKINGIISDYKNNKFDSTDLLNQIRDLKKEGKSRLLTLCESEAKKIDSRYNPPARRLSESAANDASLSSRDSFSFKSRPSR